MVVEKGLVKANTEIMPSIAEAMQLGPILVESGMFPGITSKAQAVAKILAGREVGFGPIYSLQMIDLVKGRLHLRSEAMAALINRSGRYRYEVKDLTGEKTVIDFFADGKKVLTSIFTLDDAKRADLVKPDSGWVKYPRDMLWSRAMSFGAKKVCPELLAGFEALEDENLEVVEEEVAKAGEPPPSAWMQFWGEARKKGYYTDEAVHKALGVASLKDWLSKGKSLDEALKVLPNLTAEKDAQDLYRAEAETVSPEPIKLIVERPAQKTVPEGLQGASGPTATDRLPTLNPDWVKSVHQALTALGKPEKEHDSIVLRRFGAKTVACLTMDEANLIIAAKPKSQAGQVGFESQ